MKSFLKGLILFLLLPLSILVIFGTLLQLLGGADIEDTMFEKLRIFIYGE